jgi:hypothetical protein
MPKRSMELWPHASVGMMRSWNIEALKQGEALLIVRRCRGQMRLLEKANATVNLMPTESNTDYQKLSLVEM